MSVVHYRLSLVLAASLCVTLAACAPAAGPAARPPSGANAGGPQTAAKAPPEEDIDTESTIFTMLGLAKKGSQKDPGPATGAKVSPVLYQAALDTLHFVKFASEDPLGGSLVTDWYSPRDKPDERFRIDVFILSRHLTSDSVAVTVERQVRRPTGEWADSTVDRKIQEDLETKILYRARQLKREWSAAYPS
jgi:hypothetical protein